MIRYKIAIIIITLLSLSGLFLYGWYFEDISPRESIIHNDQELCEIFGGAWDGSFNTCDFIFKKSTCDKMGGNFIECKSCPEEGYCLGECISSCKFP